MAAVVLASLCASCASEVSGADVADPSDRFAPETAVGGGDASGGDVLDSGDDLAPEVAVDGGIDAAADAQSAVYVFCESSDTDTCCNCNGEPQPWCPNCLQHGDHYRCFSVSDPFNAPGGYTAYIVPCPPDLAPDAGSGTDASTVCNASAEPCSSVGGSGQVCVRGATFVRGAASTQSADYSPPESVTVSSFWMDVTEVTVASYRMCVAAGYCALPTSPDALAYYRANSNDPLPMVGIESPQMVAYCAFVGGRLPTEAEWELAARGASDRTYPWGEDIGCQYANWAGCTPGLAPVGSYPLGATPEGILDLIGNAEEVTSDACLTGGYASYSAAGTCDPYTPWGTSPWASAVLRGCHAARDGSDTDGSSTMQRCTGYERESCAPAGPSMPSLNQIGFRCVRDGR